MSKTHDINQKRLLESDLVRQCKMNNRLAQEALYARYADKMFRVAFRYIGMQADTEDIMIIAFTKAFAGISGYTHRGEGGLEAWIRAIVINESLMWLRRRHNFNVLESLDDNLSAIETVSFSRLPEEDIYQFIAQLPTGYRTIFNMYVVEGFEHAEIAKRLGITESTSRTQLFKARNMLKKKLTDEGFQYGT